MFKTKKFLYKIFLLRMYRYFIAVLLTINQQKLGVIINKSVETSKNPSGVVGEAEKPQSVL